MSPAPKESKPRLSKSSFELIRATLEGHFADNARLRAAEEKYKRHVPAKQQRLIEAVLGHKAISYRDGLIIQLAFRLSSKEPLDITKRWEGARAVAGMLSKVLSKAQVPSVADAYQNIAKNSEVLTRGNVAEFDSFLRWAASSERRREELEAAFDYICGRVTATAKPVKRMPELDQGKLTFARVMDLFEAMFSAGSQGAYEQLIVAALLEARFVGDPEKRRVVTKNLTASDRSSAAAGDIQLWAGSTLLDAFEVTANQWTEKLDGAEKTIRDHDLSRLNIIGRVEDHKAMLGTLTGINLDLAVTDLRAFCSVQVGSLRKAGRQEALRRLHELLVRYQPDVEKVNRYVDLLIAKKLTVSS